MSLYRVQANAGLRIDEIYRYSREVWGEAKAQHYIRGLFEHFQKIAEQQVAWRPIPVEFGVEGYFSRYERHFVYWKVLGDGAVGIVTVLHQRMHQGDRFREDVEG
jgi:toxin ParE1/3/4